MVVVGIDPGQRGGIGILSDNTLADVFPMSLLPDKNIDCAALHRLLLIYSPDIIFIEKSQSMPKMNVRAVFTYGKSYGKLLAVIECLKIPYKEISPRKWKNYFNLSSDKNKSVSMAIKLFPYLKDEFYTKRGRLLDGNAEALLIAHYGKVKEL